MRKKLKKKRYVTRNHDFLQTREWGIVRERILLKQGKACLRCGSTKSINVDHVFSRFTHPELALTESNLQVLCNPCNKDKGIQTADYRSSELMPETARSKTVDYILRKSCIST